MALEESDREDLLGQAVQMPRRILIQVVAVNSVLDGLNPKHPAKETSVCTNESCEVFIGQRKTGGVSIYFDADPVFQFTQGNELRRAFVSGRKYATRTGQLHLVENLSRGGNVGLEWQPLDAAEFAAIEERWNYLWNHFLKAFHSGEFKIVGQVPENQGLPRWFSAWISSVPSSLKIAAKPNAD